MITKIGENFQEKKKYEIYTTKKKFQTFLNVFFSKKKIEKNH
jgi:hypothetical protein